jgi:hypothetical protein
MTSGFLQLESTLDTINGVMSWEQILEVFINQLDDEEQQFGYFQHDGATASTTKANIAYS